MEYVCEFFWEKQDGKGYENVKFVNEHGCQKKVSSVKNVHNGFLLVKKRLEIYLFCT